MHAEVLSDKPVSCVGPREQRKEMGVFLLSRVLGAFSFCALRDRVKEWVRRMVRQIKNVHIDDCVLISASTGAVAAHAYTGLSSSCSSSLPQEYSSTFIRVYIHKYIHQVHWVTAVVL